MKNYLTSKLEQIIKDNTSGSKELLEKLHSAVKNNPDDISIELVGKLRPAFGSFQSIQSYLDNLTQALNNNTVDDFIRSFDAGCKVLLDTLYQNFLSEAGIKNCFLTISNSLTLFEIFKRYSWDNKHLEVIISEGRPINEGRILAQKLSVQNINVTLATEAQAFGYMKKTDAVIIGADKILPNGNVVNKVGSNNLAMLASHFNIPFYVIADNSKFSHTNEFNEEEKTCPEIWKDKPAKIKIVNNYFEQVDKKLITKIITD